MPLSPQEFAAALSPLRASLVHQAMVNRHCSHEDAEDLVADTVCQALHMLPGFNGSSAPSLYTWLKSILGIMILRDRRRSSVTIAALPMAAAAHQAAPWRERSPVELLKREVAALPCKQGDVVFLFLNGYSQGWIAERLQVHRNTVANRLKLGFATLGMDLRDGDEITYETPEGMGGHVSVYVRQNSQARHWRNHHPADRLF